MKKQLGQNEFLANALKYGWPLPGMNIDFCIIAPDIVKSEHDDDICIFHVDPIKYPNGVTITAVEITLRNNGFYGLTYQEWQSNSPSAPTYKNDIKLVNITGQGHKKVVRADLDDDFVAAGNYIYVTLPATNVPWVAGKIIFEAVRE